MGEIVGDSGRDAVIRRTTLNRICKRVGHGRGIWSGGLTHGVNVLRTGSMMTRIRGGGDVRGIARVPRMIATARGVVYV